MAANDFKHLEIVLVGQQDILKAELNKHKVLGGKITIVEATEVIEWAKRPWPLSKRKKFINQHLRRPPSEKEVDAAMSAGNTGPW